SELSSVTLQRGVLGAVAVIIEGIDYILLTDTFKDRLQWDKQTGLFTITDFSLQYLLCVLSLSLDTQNCSVLCSVENDRDVTLSWTREKEILNKTSSPHLKTTLSLRLDIERHPETYYCEAKNPVSSERLRVNLRYIPVIPSTALLVFPGVFLFYFIKQKPGDGTQVLCFTCSSLLISVHACW
uniref:SLAM family member 5-like n=1 Tax=Scleropages formosus TaxID=113540 RepID=A0A8C9W6D8_SCLFO